MINDAIVKFKSYLSECFHIKDLGVLKFFLGVEKLARNPNGVFLCQREYALDILSGVGLFGSKPTSGPFEQQHWLPLADGQLLGDP